MVGLHRSDIDEYVDISPAVIRLCTLFFEVTFIAHLPVDGFTSTPIRTISHPHPSYYSCKSTSQTVFLLARFESTTVGER